MSDNDGVTSQAQQWQALCRRMIKDLLEKQQILL